MTAPILTAMALYAAYGSNLDPTAMAQRAPTSPVHGTGWLHGWRLTFGGQNFAWEGALATVVEDPTSQVFVMLYDVPPWDEAALDEWEGTALGVYAKMRVRVDTLDGRKLAWLYVLDDYEGGLPSAHYLGIMADAAEAAGPRRTTCGAANPPCRSVGPGPATA